jgi:acyl carrier protein
VTEAEVRQKLRAFIVENFLYTRRDFAFSDDDSLLRTGVFDSLGVMEIVGHIEETWGFTVAADDVTERNFDTVAGMARYVTSRSL